MSSGKPLSAEDVARIERLYTNGFSIRDICDMTNYSYGCVHQRLRKAGILRTRSEAVQLMKARGY